MQHYLRIQRFEIAHRYYRRWGLGNNARSVNLPLAETWNGRQRFVIQILLLSEGFFEGFLRVSFEDRELGTLLLEFWFTGRSLSFNCTPCSDLFRSSLLSRVLDRRIGHNRSDAVSSHAVGAVGTTLTIVCSCRGLWWIGKPACRRAAFAMQGRRPVRWKDGGGVGVFSLSETSESEKV